MMDHWMWLDKKQYGDRAGWYKCRVIKPHPVMRDLVLVKMIGWSNQHWHLKKNVKTTLELFVMGINAEQQYEQLMKQDG